MDTAERYKRVLQWTPSNEYSDRRTITTRNAKGQIATCGIGPSNRPAPWPWIMTIQRLAWHGRTQEAFEAVARLS